MRVREVFATRAALLGFVGLFFGVFAPFAIAVALRSLRNIHRAQEGIVLTGEGSAAFGLFAGIVGTITLVGGVAVWLVSAL